MNLKVLLVVTSFTAILLTGCVVALGNKVPEERAGKGAPTLGKQLTDLKQARDSGALNEEEYQTARKRLLEAPSAPAHH